MSPLRAAALMVCALLVLSGEALAFRPREEGGFDARILPDPAQATDVAAQPLDRLPERHPLRLGWERFASRTQGTWHVQVDARSGAPLLAVSSGLAWPVAPPQGWDAGEASLRELEASLRAFVAENRDLLLAADAELVFDREASGPVGPHAWRAVFRREVGGIPVDGDRYLFTFGYGRLVHFGASRWTPMKPEARGTTPSIPAAVAAEALMAYMGLSSREEAGLLAPPSLRFVPQRSEGGEPRSGAYAGEVGRGYASALVWRVVLSVAGEPGTWVGLVDAEDGRILAFYDDDRYARAMGGVHPESADGACPGGCEQAGFPMPFATMAIAGGSPVTSNAMGVFTCTAGGTTATTQLASPTVRIADACGTLSESAPCGTDVDLSVHTGTDCTVPAGHSAGDTKAARTAFYTFSRMKLHARSWLTGNVWLTSVQTPVNTNVNQTCNALWSAGVLNLYRRGTSSCRNTGELAGVIQHEWGHGLDENDGGGFTSPAEGYADVVEFLADHTSCIGRGFFVTGTCSGYGDPCLTCTGIRDVDWNARAAHSPMTVSDAASCVQGASRGPCNRSSHCEGLVVGEAVWDLAVRDLPAAGVDTASAWQLVDRLFYQSRTGASGALFECSDGSGGCVATSLYLAMLSADDDNGNLLDGTPHMTAIFAAFDRHGIACSTPAPVNSGGSPVVLFPTLSATAADGAVGLSWTSTPSPGAASWRILRSDLSCTSSFTTVATAAGAATSHSDTGLPNGFPLHYRVQAVGSNAAHESRVSNCVTVAAGAVAKPVPEMFAWRIGATTIGVLFDVDTCTSTNHQILYGMLASLPSYTPSGAVCGIGTSGSTTWTGVPAGNLWFLVTGMTGTGTEASWGPATAGERNGGSASGLCGNIVRNDAATCP